MESKLEHGIKPGRFKLVVEGGLDLGEDSSNERDQDIFFDALGFLWRSYSNDPSGGPKSSEQLHDRYAQVTEG